VALYSANLEVVTLDITPILTTQIYLCHLKEVELSEAARVFVQCAESQSAAMDLLSEPEALRKQAL